MEPATRKGSPGVEFSTALLSTVMGAKFELRQASEGGNAARFPSCDYTYTLESPRLAIFKLTRTPTLRELLGIISAKLTLTLALLIVFDFEI